MNIKKFQAGTRTEAILMVQEELGNDAIIMNIKTIKPKGIARLFKKTIVEVTAAIDDSQRKEDENQTILSTIKEISKISMQEETNQINYNMTESPTMKDAPIKQESPSAIEERLNNLQQLLEQQMNLQQQKREEKQVVLEEVTINQEKEKKEEIFENNCVKLILEQLIRNEVDVQYAKALIKEIEHTITKDASVDKVLAAIYQKIILRLGQPREIELERDEPKFVFFIGPTGVGKTTTIAKVASTFKLNQRARVALVTSDTYRIAAVEQIRTYANILNMPLKVIYTFEEMKSCKEEFHDYDLVLIDTAGRSHRNKEQRDDIEKIIQSIDSDKKEVYLVLSATTKYRDLIEITQAYTNILNYRLIFTKIDETNAMGNVFNIKMLTKASLSYMTWGQNVPDDIGTMDMQYLAKQLLGGND